jgi:hypothetical protein
MEIGQQGKKVINRPENDMPIEPLREMPGKYEFFSCHDLIELKTDLYKYEHIGRTSPGMAIRNGIVFSSV